MKSGEIVESVSRGTFWLAAEKVAGLLSGVAYFALLLRWLGPTKYGIMTLALSFTGLATMATGNFEMFLERYAAEYEARGLGATLRRAHLLALQVKVGLGLLTSAALLAITPALARQFAVPELRLLVPVLVVTVAFDGFSTTGRATLFGTQRFKWVAFLSAIFHVAKTLMVGLLWWTRHGLLALAVGLATLTLLQGMAQAVVPLWLLRRAADHEPPSPDRSWRGLLRSMLGYCVPLLGARVTFLSGQNLSKIILGRLFDTTYLGYFSFAYQTIERFVELVHTAPTALLPSLTRLVARGERERLRLVFDQALRLIQTLACTLSFGLFVFARELTLLVGSPLFEPAIPMLRVLALVPIARTAQQPLTMLFQSLRRPGTVLTLSVVKFVTEFGGYFLLVTTLGIVGAAWANLAGAVASYLVGMVLLGRVLPDGAPGRVRTGLAAVALLLPFLGLTLLLDWQTRGIARVLLHCALVLPAGVGLFLAGLVRLEDLDKLAAVGLERPWARLVRASALLVLGFFARLAAVRRTS